MPHELTERYGMDHVLICDSLVRCTFLKRLITGDEEWITNDNNVKKRIVFKFQSSCTDYCETRFVMQKRLY